MKFPLVSICIVAIVGVVIGTIAMAVNTVTCTVTPGNYSVSVDPATADYGAMLLNATETSAQITATNDGTLTEKINILGSDATSTTYTWTLDVTPAIAPGEDIYVHAYTTKATPPATGATLGSDATIAWVPLEKTASYLVLSASVAASGTQAFYLDMRTPATAGAETDYGSEYSSTITLQAVAP